MGKPFEAGNTYGKAGRPAGSRNKLAKHVFEDLIEVWNEPISPGSDIRRGPAALRIMMKTRSADFCKLFASLMPREFFFEHSTIAQLDDVELDKMIEMLRQRALEARQEQALPAPRLKVIEHAH